MKQVTIYTKGISKSNPGPAAIGVLLVDADGSEILRRVEGIGNATSDYDEYFAVVRGLQLAVDEFGEETKEIDFELKVTNELVRNHMVAEAQIKDVSLIGHFIEIYNIRVASYPNLDITLIDNSPQALLELLGNSLDV